MRNCISRVSQKPSARKISVATKTALAITGVLSAAKNERHGQKKSGEAKTSPRKEGERR